MAFILSPETNMTMIADELIKYTGEYYELVKHVKMVASNIISTIYTAQDKEGIAGIIIY